MVTVCLVTSSEHKILISKTFLKTLGEVSVHKLILAGIIINLINCYCANAAQHH